MTFKGNNTRKERLSREEKIPGSKGWTLMKNNGVFPARPITRNNMNIKSTMNLYKESKYSDEVQKNGWKFDKNSQTWMNESYENKVFPSIYRTYKTENGDVRAASSVPYCNNDDPLGLAYNFIITNGGSNMTINSNKWKSEEFDTRQGRRRELYRYKKDIRNKYSQQFQEYKDKHREEDGEDYEREFTMHD